MGWLLFLSLKDTLPTFNHRYIEGDDKVKQINMRSQFLVLVFGFLRLFMTDE